MRITLLQIDKTQDSYLMEGIDAYIKRLKNYATLDITTINVPKTVRQRSFNEQKNEEAKLIFNHISPEDFLILLDDKGKEYSSMDFSKFIAQKQNASTKRLVFLIGGPFGFDSKIYERANFKLSFSKMTFSHQMIRLFFVEQLYRAYTILKGEKYHHE
ncbi:23S rRNA (pseudouridine(1915)-N(3))-methyltransferase RlmH [Aurantibacillus circumpalustris]|uniref:23S rRNA (pseudouridine(1915)-N(3))-methyltransferase RlmH n=1 Tax=Aurantibacillus circumpalustris TaxID=3036359 RepID=UPI00295B96BE|nr:23S rRNA (pseudouridine(1915)-N(3))-methyltransferase RlmH [Aurantibacillus circumpalustris]